MPALEEAIKYANSRREIAPIKLEMDIQSGVIIPGDGSKLKRVGMNIISNAVDVLKDLKVENPVISIVLRTEGNRALLSIKDNGPGIPEDFLPKLFEPFATRNKADGTGLGLSIVKQYVEAHDGSIEVLNDQGATFNISLPLG